MFLIKKRNITYKFLDTFYNTHNFYKSREEIDSYNTAITPNTAEIIKTVKSQIDRETNKTLNFDFLDFNAKDNEVIVDVKNFEVKKYIFNTILNPFAHHEEKDEFPRIVVFSIVYLIFKLIYIILNKRVKRKYKLTEAQQIDYDKVQISEENKEEASVSIERLVHELKKNKMILDSKLNNN